MNIELFEKLTGILREFARETGSHHRFHDPQEYVDRIVKAVREDGHRLPTLGLILWGGK